MIETRYTGAACSTDKGHHCVTGLMVNHTFLITGRHHAILLLEAEHNPIDGFFEVRHLHLICITANRQECRLIDDIGEIRSHHARGACCNHLQVDVRR